MRWLYTLPLRLRSIFRRSQVEKELDDELRFHLDQRIEQEIAASRAFVAEMRASAQRDPDASTPKTQSEQSHVSP